MDLPGACSNFAPVLKPLVGAVPRIRRRPRWGAGTRVSADNRGELAAESSRPVGILDAKLREQAARRYQGGETLRQIAADLGVGRERLGAALRADGLRTRRQQLPPETVGEMVRRYQAGESLTVLSAHFGLSPGTIRMRLLEADVALRDHHGRLA